MTSERKRSRTGSSLWQRALERYREDLEENGDMEAVNDVASLDDLLTYIKTFEDRPVQDRSRLDSMRRLGPTLKFIDDFSAVVAVFLGADTKLTALVWGSIRMVLSLASSTADTLKDIADMLEELALTLPRFRAYEDTLPLDRPLEAALVDVYTEVICFYARCIHFYRTNPQVMLHRPAWQDVRNDFSRTVKRIRRLASAVEREADLARMRRDDSNYKEVLELMDSLRSSKIDSGQESVFIHQIPSKISPRFWGRDDIFIKIDEALSPAIDQPTPKSFALFGMGGVGKTQIALQYANRSRKLYHTILWLAADTVISIGQSVRDAAETLNLLHTDEELRDSVLATVRLKKWLAESRLPWLVIFDNADDLEVLRSVWPTDGSGSILLTSRDSSAPFSPASSGIHIQPFDVSMGAQVLLNYVGLSEKTGNNTQEATDISRALGGLPLALGQIGGFITQRRIRLKDFLPLYDRNAAAIHSRKTGLSDYEHTLSTVWSMSVTKLGPESRTLLTILAFLQPDAVEETILSSRTLPTDTSMFEFLQDEMSLGDAEEELLRTGLIDKDAENAILSVHRLVQDMVIRSLNEAERAEALEFVIDLLSVGFPDTHSADPGHQYASWTSCERTLPHVHHLVGSKKKYKMSVNRKDRYAELLRRCSWYLYERELYDTASEMIVAAIDSFEDKSSIEYTAALATLGYIEIDLANSASALERFQEAHRIRAQQLPEVHHIMAGMYNDMAVAFTETGELEEAYKLHNKAIEVRLALNSDRVGNSYSNMASLLLRMGKADEAEDMLARCPSLRDLNDETLLATGNPRFSGDMVLLSRIRYAQGRLSDATRLASKALNFRQKMLGNRLKACDSLFDVAYFISKQGNVASAIEILYQLTDIATTVNEGKGQLARAHWLLSILQANQGRTEESNSSEVIARDVRSHLRPDLASAPFEEQEFRKLCLWMLW